MLEYQATGNRQHFFTRKGHVFSFLAVSSDKNETNPQKMFHQQWTQKNGGTCMMMTSRVDMQNNLANPALISHH